MTDSSSPPDNSKTRIIHFSDPHAGGPAEDLLAYLDKRWVGVFNYNFRRKFQHDLSTMERLVSNILTEPPDLVVCTGDITSTGQPGEFRLAVDILRVLVEAGIPMIYMPGNHDCYVRNRKCRRALADAFKFLNTFFGLEFADLPLKIRYRGIDLLLVNESWPTNLLSSCGYLRPDSRDFVVKECSEPKNSPRILVAHYPLIEERPILRMRHRLWGQREVARCLDNGDLDLSLCGHMHLPYAKLDANGRGEICAGSITRNNCAAEIIVHRNDENRIYYRKIMV